MVNNVSKSSSSHAVKAVAVLTLLAAAAIIAMPPSSSLWTEKGYIYVNVETADYMYPRSKGFWSHQFSVAITGSPGGMFDAAELDSMLLDITASSRVFSFTQATTTGRLAAALDILEPPYADMEENLRAQLLALWLNQVSGFADGYVLTYDGVDYTAMDIIVLAEDVLNAGDTSSYESLKDLIEAYNTNWG